MALVPDPWFCATAIPAVVLSGLSKGGPGGAGATATPLASCASYRLFFVTGAKLLYDGITGL